MTKKSISLAGFNMIYWWLLFGGHLVYQATFHWREWEWQSSTNTCAQPQTNRTLNLILTAF